MFRRSFNDELIEQLLKSDLYVHRISKDIRTGDVFPAIRTERMDFYHKGGKLFTFDKDGFKTHIKYASVYKSKDDYVSESKIMGLERITSFVDGYARIKENCSLYSGSESAGVADIYSRYSYVISRSSAVVLDIEVSLKSLDPSKKQDRIDILLLDKNKKRLIFCEAKNFLNKEIWPPKGTSPEVANQIRRYEEQIKSKGNNILEQYRYYIDSVREIFPIIDLPYPDSICLSVLLMVFGFDRDQLSGKRFNDLFKANLPENIMYYAIGDISGLKIESVFKKCNL